ncbi:MAG: hypothetical protein AAF845_02025 [Bacteroidota bacterium]
MSWAPSLRTGRGVLVAASVLVLAACGGSRPEADRAAPAVDGAYGMTPETAIRVGRAGAEGSGGPARERAYLDRLRGPSGAPVSYARQQSCCPFETPNGMLGASRLDVYEVWGAGLDGRVTLYLNMYDPPSETDVDRAPPGFTLVRE